MANLVGPDVSFYQDDDETPRQIDFLKMSQEAGYVIIRAGQRNWVDPDFAYNWQQAKLYKLPRGSYWFYDSRYEPVAQAELWAEAFQGDFGELPLFADFEKETWTPGPYAGWKNYKIFLERIKKLAITKEIAIYTAYYHWKDDVNVPVAEQPYFSQFPLWIANYGATSPLIPAPWSDGEWLFWQYTESGDGKKYGAESNNIDLNYFHGDLISFRERFGLDAPDVRPLDVESHTTPFEGVQLHRVFRHGSWCSVAVIEPEGKRFLVTPFKMRTTSQAAKDLKAQLVMNGGAHNSARAIGLHVTEARQLQGQDEFEPFCNFGSYQMPTIEYYDSRIMKYNSLAGKRMIVENGLISPNTSAAWYELHPRTLIGVDGSGRSVWCTIDGRQNPYSKGATLFEAAMVMVEFGCVRAIDLDGGGSTALCLQRDGSYNVVNYPIDTGIPGKERIVGNHIAMFVGGITDPPQGESMRYKVLIAVKPRPTPAIAGGSKPNLPVGYEFDSTVMVNGTPAGTTFVQLPDGDYVPLIYLGKEYVKEIPVTVPSPVVYPPFVFLQLPDANGILQPGKFYDVRI